MSIFVRQSTYNVLDFFIHKCKHDLWIIYRAAVTCVGVMGKTKSGGQRIEILTEKPKSEAILVTFQLEWRAVALPASLFPTPL